MGETRTMAEIDGWAEVEEYLASLAVVAQVPLRATQGWVKK